MGDNARTVCSWGQCAQRGEFCSAGRFFQNKADPKAGLGGRFSLRLLLFFSLNIPALNIGIGKRIKGI